MSTSTTKKPRKRQPFGNITRLPSGRYRARYQDPTALPKRVWINAPRTYEQKMDAEWWLHEVKLSMDRGTWEHPADVASREAEEEAAAAARAKAEAITVAVWADRWLAGKRLDGTADSTIRTYATRIHHIKHGRAGKHALGDVRLVDLTPEMISDWYDALPSDGVRVPSYLVLRIIMKAAVTSDDTPLAKSPCVMRRPRRASNSARSRHELTSGEVDAIVAAIRPELRALVVLLADAGLRIREALALRRRDVHLFDDGRGMVVVEHSLVRGETGELELGPTKTRTSRSVQLRRGTVAELRDHMDTYTGTGGNAPVFPALTSKKRFMHAAAVWKDFTSAVSDAEIELEPGEYLGLHALRHYSATVYGRRNVPLDALMKRYGWRSTEVAMLYQHTDAAYERGVLDLMDAEDSSGVVSLTERRAERAG